MCWFGWKVKQTNNQQKIQDAKGHISEDFNNVILILYEGSNNGKVEDGTEIYNDVAMGDCLATTNQNKSKNLNNNDKIEHQSHMLNNNL